MLPLVRADAERGVGFAVSEAPLNVDEVVVEGDQHAGVTLAEVVQGGLRLGARRLYCTSSRVSSARFTACSRGMPRPPEVR